MTVASILTEKGRNVLTVTDGTSMSQVVDILASKKIGALVVVDDKGRLAGIVSERDVVRDISVSGPAILDKPVSACMTRAVISCGESDTIEQVMNVMTANRFRHMPVVTAGNLVGIISIGDVVKRKIQQAEKDAEDLRNYIAAG